MEWKTPPSTPPLAEGDIHVWRAALDLDGGALASAWATLSSAERRRAERMRFAVHRARFVAGRGVLRILLGRYLDVPPERVSLVATPEGRPALDPPSLRFSVAHTGALALYAFALDRAVGVDVERLRREVPIERLATRFFAHAEARALAELPSAVRPAAFFACWTRKEAVFKAWGATSGLVPSLKRFAVSVAPRETRTAVTFFDDPSRSGRWWLTTLDAAPGHAAALAVEGPAAATCFSFDWPA